MNSFISRVQKDLNRFQKAFQKESDDLVKKIKKLGDQAKKNKVAERRKEIENLIETKLRGLEPVFDKLFKEIKVSARKYGIDLTGIEKRVTTSLGKSVKKATKKKAAKKKATANKATKKSTAKKATKKTTAKKATKKATAKKTSAKKATKKTTAKKTTAKKATKKTGTKKKSVRA